jgi:hypothetical protein
MPKIGCSTGSIVISRSLQKVSGLGLSDKAKGGSPLSEAGRWKMFGDSNRLGCLEDFLVGQKSI